MSILPKIIVIVGPTASGKSDLAVKIAKHFKGEIISADSRQVYKGLNIGSGKITKKEMEGIPHWMLDIASPKRIFTVAQYKKQALEAIQNIFDRGKLPILVGGTGFYIQAVIDDISIPNVPPHNTLRKKFESKTEIELYRLLKKLDPRRAQSIDRNNKRRLIRAIEIVKKLGKVPTLKKSKQFNVLFIGINIPRNILKKKIEKRLFKRVQQGMGAEIRHLNASGISWKRLEQLGLEYRYVSLYLQKKLSKKEMVEKLKIKIWQYARRQFTWFRKEKRIHWIYSYTQAQNLIKRFLQ